jgi:hypothetical protein
MNTDAPNPGYLRTINTYALIAAVTIVANLLTIANPGFQSHDEWQIYDFVRKYGLNFFLRAYIRVYAGSEFGTPVRPLGFLQQGLLSQWMPSAPIVPHLFSVGLLMVTGLLLFRVLTAAAVNRQRAVAAAILFGTSPLTAFATGWTAALFDPWYALFALLAAWAVVSIIDRGFSVLRVAALAVASALAILSKETAIILPAAAGALALSISLLRGAPLQWRKAFLIGVISASPVLCYLAIRFPAIMVTLHGNSALAYPPSIANVPGNLLGYFAFPALISTAELPPIAFLHTTPLLAALAVHLLIIFGLLIRLGWTAACAYVAAYFVFLMPVLTLPSPGSHYLYASGFATSLALGCLLFDAAGRFRPGVVAIPAVACVSILCVHTIEIQRDLYDNGRCQHDFLLSLDLRMGETTGPIIIRADPGVQWGNGVRAIHGRDRYERVTVTGSGSNRPGNYRMDWSCRVLPAPKP